MQQVTSLSSRPSPYHIQSWGNNPEFPWTGHAATGSQLGVLLKDAQQLDSVLIHPWMLIPALPVVLTVACYFLLGDGLRDAVDPYSS